MPMIRNAICLSCNLIFDYTEDEVYEKMEVPPPGATRNPYGYIRYVVDCPKCGKQVPAIKNSEN